MQREQRYLVLKISDINDYLTMREITGLESLTNKLNDLRVAAGKSDLDCVVVESDWKCYDAVWKLIEDEVDAKRHASNYQ